MFALLWFLFIAFAVTFSLSWLLDHNGDVTITWLGYQLQSDVLTAILLTALFAVFLFIISYLLARILALRFPAFLKFLFRRSYVRHLEKVIKRHHQAFETMSKALLALEAGDDGAAKKQQKDFSKLVKYRALNDFFLAKIYFEDQQFEKSAEYFVKFGENRHAKVLALRARFENALKNHEDVKAMAYGKQILSVQKDNLLIARKLFALYKRANMQLEVDELVKNFGEQDLAGIDEKRHSRKPNFFKKIFSRS